VVMLGRGEVRVPVADQERGLRHMVAEVLEQGAGLLGDPVRGGMCGDAEDVSPAGGVFDDRDAGQPGKEHGVAVEEVTRHDPTRVGAQKRRPDGAGGSGDGSILAR
jgi:hypothetical protein